MRGAEPEATCRKYVVLAATLTDWRDAFLQGGENGLKSQTGEVLSRCRVPPDSEQSISKRCSGQESAKNERES